MIPGYKHDPMPEIPAGGTKHDGGKLQWELLHWSFIEEIVKVMTFGAKKYDAYNWQKGIKTSRLWGAIFRHLTAVIKGDTIDKESGISHLAHAACNIMFLYWMMLNRPDLDDQPCEMDD